MVFIYADFVLSAYISRRILQDTVDLISTIIRVGVDMRNTKCQSTTSITTLMKNWPRIKTLGYTKMMTSNIISIGKTITWNCISSYRYFMLIFGIIVTFENVWFLSIKIVITIKSVSIYPWYQNDVNSLASFLVASNESLTVS